MQVVLVVESPEQLEDLVQLYISPQGKAVGIVGVIGEYGGFRLRHENVVHLNGTA